MTKEELKQRRLDLGLSQEKLAALLYGTTKQTIYRWEAGIHKVPSWVSDKLKEIEANSKNKMSQK